MNQSILFNDDLRFNEEVSSWTMSAQLLGELKTIYFHSVELKQQVSISQCMKYDLEEIVELWLEKNEPEGSEIHIQMD